VPAPVAEELIDIVDIAVEPKAGGGPDTLWTYRVDAPARLGDAFIIPLGPRAVIGYAVGVRKVTEAELGFPIEHLRRVLDKVVGLEIPSPVLELVRFVAKEYLCPLNVSLSAAISPGARERLVTGWRLIEPVDMAELSAVQKETVRTLREQNGVILERPGRKLPPSTVRVLKVLRQKGVVEQTLHLQPLGEKKDDVELFQISSDKEKVESFLKKEGKKKPAQAMTLMRLQTAEPTPLSAVEIKALSGVTDTTLKAMVNGGLLDRIDQIALVPREPPVPNGEQSVAIKALTQSVAKREFASFLLFGVTGSGKTEVYLSAAAEALRQGRQVLYLVPEIALAAQVIAQLRERFGKRVAVLHSELTARERLENWMRVRDGDAPVVLGARSALFAPLTNIGLIVMDEEHETSYKQESSPRYHSKKLVLQLGKTHGATVVLGSATPSVETYSESESGVIQRLMLEHRAAEASLPTIHIEDLTEGYKSGHPSLLSEQLGARIEATLGRKEQVILFLNRRAYSPFLICRDCGHQFKCPRCAVSLAYSRNERRLRCHHCGHNEFPPDVCPECKGNRLNPMGVGTEKVEEAVSAAFPAAIVARLDRDIARKKGALEETLARFRSGEIQILVGTQMVAKGLDFPNVTLVGVIAADISLSIPDFRSSERTFQLLSQVAGRAGRGQSPGHVVIQTFSPNHMAIQATVAHDYLAFFREAVAEREAASYPPFARLVNIVVSGESLEEVRARTQDVADALQALPNAAVLGPAQCAIERVQHRWRRHVLVKLGPEDDATPVADLIKPIAFKKAMAMIDVDPYSLI